MWAVRSLEAPLHGVATQHFGASCPHQICCYIDKVSAVFSYSKFAVIVASPSVPA